MTYRYLAAIAVAILITVSGVGALIGSHNHPAHHPTQK